MSDKALRAQADRELTQKFNRFNKFIQQTDDKGLSADDPMGDFEKIVTGSDPRVGRTKQFDVGDEEMLSDFMKYIKRVDPEGFAKMQKIADDINEKIEAANKRAAAMEEKEALKKKGRKLNAGGGLNYLMGL